MSGCITRAMGYTFCPTEMEAKPIFSGSEAANLLVEAGPVDIGGQRSASYEYPQPSSDVIKEAIRKRALKNYRKWVKTIIYPYNYDPAWTEEMLGGSGIPNIKSYIGPFKNRFWNMAVRRAAKKTKIEGNPPAIPRPKGLHLRGIIAKQGFDYMPKDVRVIRSSGICSRGISGGSILGTVASMAGPLVIKGLVSLGKYIYNKYKEKKEKKRREEAQKKGMETRELVKNLPPGFKMSGDQTVRTIQDIAGSETVGGGDVPTEYQMSEAAKIAEKAAKKGLVGYPNPFAFPTTGGTNSLDLMRDVLYTAGNILTGMGMEAKIKSKKLVPFVTKFISKQAKNLFGKGAKTLLRTGKKSKPFKHPFNAKQVVEPLVALGAANPEELYKWKRYFKGIDTTSPLGDMSKELKSKIEEIQKQYGSDKAKYEAELEKLRKDGIDPASAKAIPMWKKIWSEIDKSRSMNTEVTGSGIEDILSSVSSFITGGPMITGVLDLGNVLGGLANYIGTEAKRYLPTISTDAGKEIVKSAFRHLSKPYYKLFPRNPMKDVVEEEIEIESTPEAESEESEESDEGSGRGASYSNPTLVDMYRRARHAAKNYGLFNIGESIVKGSGSFMDWLSGTVWPAIKKIVPAAAAAIIPAISSIPAVAEKLPKSYADTGRKQKSKASTDLTEKEIENLKYHAGLAKDMAKALEKLREQKDIGSPDYTRRMARVLGYPSEYSTGSETEKLFGVQSDPSGYRLPNKVLRALEDPDVARELEKKRKRKKNPIQYEDVDGEGGYTETIQVEESRHDIVNLLLNAYENYVVLVKDLLAEGRAQGFGPHEYNRLYEIIRYLIGEAEHLSFISSSPELTGMSEMEFSKFLEGYRTPLTTVLDVLGSHGYASRNASEWYEAITRAFNMTRSSGTGRRAITTRNMGVDNILKWRELYGENYKSEFPSAGKVGMMAKKTRGKM